MRGGRSPRQKGNRSERALVRYFQDHGFAAERIPLSGSAGGRFAGDLSVPVLGVDRRVEVKVRGNGFRELYAWLGDRDFLIVRADRLEPLVVIPLKLATEIAVAAEKATMTQLEVQLELFDSSTALGVAPCKSTRGTIFDGFIKSQLRFIEFLREQEIAPGDPGKGD